MLIAVVIGAFLCEIASGEDGEPYSQLGAIAGVARASSRQAGEVRGDESVDAPRNETVQDQVQVGGVARAWASAVGAIPVREDDTLTEASSA